MAIIELNTVKTILGISLADTSLDTLITALIPVAQSVVETFIGWKLDSASNTEFYSGNGTSNLILNRKPVTLITSINVDNEGAFGQKVGAFGAGTLLEAGVDYASIEITAGFNPSGIVKRLNSPFSIFNLFAAQTGYLSRQVRQGTPWPYGQGNIKIIYTAGYNTGNCPGDLQQAISLLIAWMKNNNPNGGLATLNESLGAASYGLGAANNATGSALSGLGELGTVRQILSRYRGWSAGGSNV